MESAGHEPGGQKKGYAWPLAFFILNAGAILLWFYLSGFFTARQPTFMTISPGGENIAAVATETVDVEFDAPLDPDTVTEHSLRLIPPAAGKTELVDGRILRYRLHEKLRPATAYQAIWATTLRGKHGQRVPQELAEFSTTRLAFVDAAQSSFDRDSYTVEIAFNQPVRAADLEASLKSRFSLQDRSADRIKLITSGRTSRHQIRIRETRPSYVAITLPAGMPGAEGSLGLKDDVELVWKIAGAAPASGTATPDWAEGTDARELSPTLSFQGMSCDWEGTTGVVRVRATSPLDVQSARKHIEIEPEVDASFSSTWNALRITGDFKPGKQYRITLKRGLSAGDAGELADDVTRNIWFEDLPPRFDFSFGGGYLRPGGLLKIPVNSVNIPKLTVRLRRLYPNNLVETAMRDYEEGVDEEYAEPVLEKETAISAKKNSTAETLLDLRELAEGEPKGVYGLEVRSPSDYWSVRRATVVVSDIGLSVRVGKQRILAWTASLDTGEAKPGCSVTVYSNKRQLLAEGVTDKNGVLEMDIPPLPKGEQAILAIADFNGETTFVRLDGNRNQRNGDATSGAAFPKTYETFVSLDRGVYRGGETIKATALSRDRKMTAAAKMPLDLIVLDPEGKTIARTGGTTDSQGRITTDLAIPRNARGGKYAVEARLPGDAANIGETSFRVADYMPETLRLAISLSESLSTADPVSLKLETRRLAGGATGALPATIIAAFTYSPFKPKQWIEWTFGDDRVRRYGDKKIERHFTTDEEGGGSTEWLAPEMETYAAVHMEVRAEVHDKGGRTVAVHAGKTLHNVPYYVGIKTRGEVQSGDSPSFELAAVSPTGALSPIESAWTARLYRVEYNGLLKRRNDGRLVYDWQRQEILTDETSGEWNKGKAEASFKPVRGGGYRVVCESPGGKSVTLDFSVTGEGNEWMSDNPELMQGTVQGGPHAVGSTAMVSFVAPFAGTALITVETDNVVKSRVLAFKAGENPVAVPITEEMRPNAFVAATLIRPAKAEANWRPHRAYGVVRLLVDNADRKALVRIDAPEFALPGKETEISVNVTDSGGEGIANAAVTLWGVDEGILSLTGFRTPSPWEYFTRARRVGVQDVDMYSRLAPELEEWKNGKDPEPGGGSDGISRRMNPVSADRVRAAIIHRGDLTTDEDGNAVAVFTIPEAATTMRLMAWAASEQSFGSADRELELRAPISFTSSWPRFAAPGDEFTAHALLLNRSGKDGEAVLSVSADDDGLEFPSPEMRVHIPDGKTRSVLIPVRAAKTGAARILVTAELHGETFKEHIEIPVRAPVLFERRSGTIAVGPENPARLSPGQGLLPDGCVVTLTAGGSPQIKLAGCLESLLSYPYGCSEQTASRLAALVALPDLAALSRPGGVGPEETDRLVKLALGRLASMQNYNGGFRTWTSYGESVFWSSAQILYILEECREFGVRVPDDLLAPARRYVRDYLERHMNLLTQEDEPDFPDLRYRDGTDAALACLALAKGGDIRRAWLVRLHEIVEERRAADKPLASSALAFLCEAVCIAGDPKQADELFALYGPGGESQGIIRDAAFSESAWLSAGLRLGVPHARLADTADRLGKRLSGEYLSWNTRQNAWAAMSLGEYWRRFRPSMAETARVVVDGTENLFAAATGKSWTALAPGARIEAESPAEGTFHLSWFAEGVPLSGTAKEEDTGMTVRRTICDDAGNELSSPFALRQGEVYEVRLDVQGEADDLAIADLLPAGLEIEDPTLKGRNNDRSLSGALRVNHIERKDDRLLLFGVVRGKGSYRYLCRAVTPGTFVWPAVDASRMYDPAIRSVHGRSSLTIEVATAGDEK